MDPVRVGIIGCGGFARGMHIPNLRANPRFEVVATCDVDDQAAMKARQSSNLLRLIRRRGHDGCRRHREHNAHSHSRPRYCDTAEERTAIAPRTCSPRSTAGRAYPAGTS